MGRQKKHKPKKERSRVRRQGVLGKSAVRTRQATKIQELKPEELEAIVERAGKSLSEDDHGKLRAAIGTLSFLTREIEAKNASIASLRRLLFGASSEKTSQVLGESSAGGAGDSTNAAAAQDENAAPGSTSGASKQPKPKRKGHGRNSAAAYTGAEKVCVSHDSLKAGETCPECGKGKVYPLKEPKVLVRITGMAPLGATVYELEKLRCNLCGEVFGAREPPGIGPAKYDETAASMIALFKYGTGVPFNRLEKLQEGLGIPLPSSTQWDLVSEAAELLLPAYEELVRQAAQGEVLYNDDTTMKILELTGERRRKAIESGAQEPDQRKGIFTTGIVSAGASPDLGRCIALFFTGSKHAGENLADVLAQRADELEVPIQMCDALSHNTAGDFDSTLAHCLAHARRQFVEVVDNFPQECAVVLDALRKVYRNDAETKRAGLSPEERLAYHHKESRPVMVPLKRWLRKQVREHQTEPNSGLGKAIAYTLKHWLALTLFLREPGAPLDNNICERALKRVIINRKNAYFYKTQRGARVGDLFMSLIYTAELSGASPFEYLCALQLHYESVASHPADWMPWNYADALALTT